MKLFFRRVFLAFRKFRWRLILSYNLVTLAALFILAWWGLVAGAIYLEQTHPGLSWPELIAAELLPALMTILPSALVLIIPTWRICTRAGFSGALSLFHLVPLIGSFIVMAVLAFSPWPNGEASSGDR